jgi:purine-binding chemotaxis protein CheW
MVSEAIAPVAKTPANKTPANAPASMADAERGAQAAWLLFRAGSALCAIPLEQVIETMRPLPIAAVAGAPPYVRGLCIIRGTAVPVVDAALLLGAQPLQAERLITIRAGNRPVALATQAVVGIRTIAAETLAAMPPLLRDAARETVAAIAALDAEVLFFLHTARILPADIADRLQAEGASP